MRPLIVCGLGFGDEGKGSIVDWLAHLLIRTLVIRYNGGYQAAHNVVRPSDTWHCFAQIGSGSFEDSRTYLSRHMLIEPSALLEEAVVLSRKAVPDILKRITIDPRVTIVTPGQKMMNQMAEIARGKSRLGSCGCGIGETVADRNRGLAVFLSDVGTVELEKKLEELRRLKSSEAHHLCQLRPLPELEKTREYFEGRMDVGAIVREYNRFLESDILLGGPACLQTDDALVFEGAQGTLLDPIHGFAPYVTKTRSDHHNAIRVWGEGQVADLPWKIGVLPAYFHRHGPGPLPTEDPDLTSGLSDTRNRDNQWQGTFRVGWFDAVLAKYALLLNGGMDFLALTKLDRLQQFEEIRVCTSYRYTGDLDNLRGLAEFESMGPDDVRVTGLKVSMESHTEIMSHCQPLDWVTFRGTSDYIDGLEDLLGTPIGVISTGPTWEDKHLRGIGEKVFGASSFL